jgi:hypothetical protein
LNTIVGIFPTHCDQLKHQMPCLTKFEGNYW